MYISNEDLEFLIQLSENLGNENCYSNDAVTLNRLVEKLLHKRAVQRKKTREAVAERRKNDKNYARSKKDVSA